MMQKISQEAIGLIENSDFLSSFDIQKSTLLLFCDGSGTTKGKPCSWTSYLFVINWLSGKPIIGQEKSYSGILSSGTNNIAELLPIVHSLSDYLMNRPLQLTKEKVCVFSDSEVTIKIINGDYSASKNLTWWVAFEHLEKFFIINGFHVPRNSNSINERCDKEAGELRKQYLKLD